MTTEAPIWDIEAEWEPLSNEASTALLYDRDETNRYITRLEIAVAVLRSQRSSDTRFFDAVNALAPDVCERAMNHAEVPR